MINRELTKREKEILGMIRPITFQDMVSIVRRDFLQSKYDAKRELRNLHNGVIRGECTTDREGTINGVGIANGATNGVTSGIADREDNANGRYTENNIREICEVPI